MSVFDRFLYTIPAIRHQDQVVHRRQTVPVVQIDQKAPMSMVLLSTGQEGMALPAGRAIHPIWNESPPTRRRERECAGWVGVRPPAETSWKDGDFLRRAREGEVRRLSSLSRT